MLVSRSKKSPRCATRSRRLKFLGQAPRGFTLLELLVALAIFAVIGVAAYTALFAVLDARESSRAQSQRLAAVQYAVDTLVADLRQAVDRPVRAIEPRQRAALYAPGADTPPLIALTRGGRPNPARLPRSTLGRVQWRLVDQALERSVQSHLDAPATAEPRHRRVLDRVESVEFRFRAAGDERWSQRWPPLNASGNETALPHAIEVTLELADWGTITRLVALPRGGARARRVNATDQSGGGNG